MKTRSSLHALALVLLLICEPVQSAPLYKCDIDGLLAFQDTPCPPIRAKQKVACADVAGFADYKDTLDGDCANLAAGKPEGHKLEFGNKQKAAMAKQPSSGMKQASTTTKEVFVRGYTKEDGTRVPSHTRNMPRKNYK